MKLPNKVSKTLKNQNSNNFAQNSMKIVTLTISSLLSKAYQRQDLT